MIRTVAETGSTNADLLAAALAGAPEGEWLRAERQNGGRGRLGRPWISPAGNLYASTIIRPRAADPPAPSLALVIGVAVHEAACGWAAEASDRLCLKWPNDLLADGIKLGGILLERSADAVVAGIGINLASTPDLTDRPATSLQALTGSSPAPDDFVEDLASAVARWLAIWRGQGLPAVLAAWLAAAHPIGTALAASAGAGSPRVEGLFAGLDEEGSLLIDTPDRGRLRINAGDVILI